MALLRLFGHPVLERDGTRTPLGVPAKAVALLAIAAANYTRPLSREWLAQSLWPDADPADARANLRRHFHLLSKAIAEDLFVLSRHTAQWNADSSTVADVIRFDELARTEPALAVQEYGGELCEGAEEETLGALRLRYRSAYEALLRGLAAAAHAAGDDAALALWLQHAINHDPFDEPCVREIMLLRRRHGDRAGALREYIAFAQRLRSELSTEPEAETLALFSEIAGEEPLDATPHNLQAAATTFVGRERELSELALALQTRKIVTLTGPAGVGKTRLATRFCFDTLPTRPDGIWIADLDHCSNSAAIWEHMAGAMQIGGTGTADKRVLNYLADKNALVVLDTCEHVLDGAREVTQRIVTETSAAVLATSRRALRLIDERVIEIRALDIPPADLRPGESALRFGAYRLFLERAAMINPTFHVAPRQVRALAEILECLDGLPLAIELVASRANVLTIEGMRKRLETTMRAARRTQTNARAQTIDDAIGWSYDLLSEDQRRLFDWLSVFKGRFVIEDVERVCAQIPNAAESLFELVDASLVTIVSSEREVAYRLLETTRNYAFARLTREAQSAEAQRRHAEHFASKGDALAQSPESAIPDLLEAVGHALPDYLAALDYACEGGGLTIGLRILEGLHRFGIRNYFIDEILARALRLLEGAEPGAERARIARLAGMMADTSGRYELSLAQFEIAVAYYREQHAEQALCDALSGLAVVAYHLGRYEECERRFIEIRERTERSGDTMLTLKTQGRLGALYLSQGQFERSLPLLESAATGLRALGELRQSSFALKNLATAAHYAGHYQDAVGWANQALQFAEATSEVPLRTLALCLRACAQRELGEMTGALDSLLAASRWFEPLGKSSDLAECLEDAASTLCACGEYETAARLVGFSDAMRLEIGSPLNPGLRLYYDRTNTALRNRLGAGFESAHALGAQETPGSAVLLATQTLDRLRNTFPASVQLAG